MSIRVGVLLGEGGMGVVYDCTSEEYGSCAIKMVKDEVVEKYGADRCCSFLKKEADFIEELQQRPRASDYIVCLFNKILLESFSKHSKSPRQRPSLLLERMTMSFFEYEWNLIDKEHRNFSLVEIHKVAMQVTEALCFLRDAKVVHTDLKPGNILIAADGKLKISDFGSAIKDEGERPCSENLQTKQYKSPEVILGIRPTCAADVWSLGAMLVELYIGKRPFESKWLVESGSQDPVHLIPIHKVRFGGLGYSKSLVQRASILGRQRLQEAETLSTDLVRSWRALLVTEAKGKDIHNFFVLVRRMLTDDPQKRITPQDILQELQRETMLKSAVS